MANKNLKILPLGGLGEVGKNMTVLEYGRNMIIVDVGVAFPENDMYGIDLVLPDFSYVVENQDKLRGIVLTHGHMDHILALPYLLREVEAPVYGTRLTLGIVERQLKEKNLLHRADLRTMLPGESGINLGPFKVTPFHVAHSIPDATGLVIDTPVGKVVHTGDYKLDETPAGGYTTDLETLKNLTRDGVLALLGDSTNADTPGRTPTEAIVTETLDKIIAEAQGRVIIATFSSLLARQQEVVNLAQKHGRKVALTGRSIIENVKLARELGYIEAPDHLIVDINDPTVPDEQLVVLATGSQGEPRSALNRMADGSHWDITINGKDTVIVSGGTIPGNEETVGRMLNKLFERGANVIYDKMADVHVSGHGSREEMEIMLETVQPKFFIPVHGEPRHRHLHARMAIENGMRAEDVFIISNGAQWYTDGQKAWTGETLKLDEVFVDGRLVGEIGEIVMRDRQRLSKDGFVVALIPVNEHQQLVGDPQLVSRGFVYLKEADDLLDAGREQIRRNYRKGSHELRKNMEDFFYQQTRSRPVVLPRYVRV